MARTSLASFEEVTVSGLKMASGAKGAAEARKRRREIIQSQRSENDAWSHSQTGAIVDGPVEKKPPKKRKVEDTKEDPVETTDAANAKKTQIRYDPEVPMNKEQLAAWRREARRVRNRESAAASRQRTRSRISELEDEVSEWKAKYIQAMEKLQALEGSKASGQSSKLKQGESTE